VIFTDLFVCVHQMLEDTLDKPVSIAEESEEGR